MTLPGGQNYYECSREAVNGSEYCVLHDSSYHDRGDADMIFGALMEEIDRSRPLVGFHLLAISFVGSKFTEPLYFERCKFYGLVNFSSTDMSAPLIFSNCDFAVGANFSRAKFHCRLLFKAVRSDLAAQFDFAESFFTNIQLVGSVFGMSNFDFAELLRGKFIDSKFMGEFLGLIQNLQIVIFCVFLLKNTLSSTLPNFQDAYLIIFNLMKAQRLNHQFLMLTKDLF